MSDVHRDYLLDLGFLLKEMAVEAHRRAAQNRDDQFTAGRAMGFYEVLSLIQMQAATFALPLEDLALGGFDADRDLMGMTNGADQT